MRAIQIDNYILTKYSNNVVQLLLAMKRIMYHPAMAYRPLRRFVQKMAVVSGSQLIDQVRSARNYSSADGLPKRVAKIWIESRN